jgi:hypothetical protein
MRRPIRKSSPVRTVRLILDELERHAAPSNTLSFIVVRIAWGCPPRTPTLNRALFPPSARK